MAALLTLPDSSVLRTIVASIFCLAFAISTQGVAQSVRHRAAVDSLTAELESILRQGHFNGFGVAVVNGQGVLYQHGFGFADVQARKTYGIHTVQSVASVSKTLVGLALLKAQERGLLTLDDPVNK